MTTIRFEKDLSEFQSIVMLYRNEENNVYIGNTSFYGGSIPERQCLNILYKDPLPKDRDVMSGWNYLDDTSPKIYLSYCTDMETAVEDFMYAHGLENFTDITDALFDSPVKKGEVKAFAMKK